MRQHQRWEDVRKTAFRHFTLLVRSPALHPYGTAIDKMPSVSIEKSLCWGDRNLPIFGKY
ncbi:hypothetical protein Q5691_09300 [Microcoleus sp. w1-18aA5]|uniref:hypothetical protein n=1 Tax=unclassified Microcoleus TaxID=2642155 RepID=UPI002FD48834